MCLSSCVKTNITSGGRCTQHTHTHTQSPSEEVNVDNFFKPILWRDMGAVAACTCACTLQWGFGTNVVFIHSEIEKSVV